jgi:hypothetical protein
MGAEMMLSKLFWLDDQQWQRIVPHLPTDVRGKEWADASDQRRPAFAEERLSVGGLPT